MPSEKAIENKKIRIGPKRHQRTIIFDLDETLVSASAVQITKAKINKGDSTSKSGMNFKDNQKMDIDHEINIDFDDDSVLNIRFTIRPNAIEVLEYLAQRFELGIFTAGD